MSLTSTARRIAVTSGKGGVGKTSVTVHLATALARQGIRVGIVDADLALGNVDVLLGLSPRWHLGHVIAGERSIRDVLIDGPGGIRIAPAGSGVRALTALDEAHWVRFSRALDEFSTSVEVLLLDTATGIGDDVLDVIALSDAALVVTTCDPAALVDAYALVKLADAMDDRRPVGVLVNAVRTPSDADTAFRQLAMVADRFLGRTLWEAGAIALDADVPAAARGLRILNAAPASGAQRGFHELARRVQAWMPRVLPSGRVRPPRATDLAARMRMEVAPCA